MGQDIDRGARVRAARAIARLTQPELGQRLNTSSQTIKRMELGTRTPDLDELRQIADACGVPRWFMEKGWAVSEEMTEDNVRAIVQLEVAAAMRQQGRRGDEGRRAPGEQAG